MYLLNPFYYLYINKRGIFLKERPNFSPTFVHGQFYTLPPFYGFILRKGKLMGFKKWININFWMISIKKGEGKK